MKYIPTWLNKSWGTKSGFKGHTKHHTVEYDRNNPINQNQWNRWNINLNGYFTREDLLKLVYEIEYFITADTKLDKLNKPENKIYDKHPNYEQSPIKDIKQN